MGRSSDEESDISDSDVQEYKDKRYELLKAGTYKILGHNGGLKCPFCVGKKKQEYQYYHLYQHADGVGKGSTKSAKQRANHLALATYLEVNLADQFEKKPLKLAPEPVPAAKSQHSELYCWPWVGIIVNIVDYPTSSASVGNCSYWMDRFSKYKPVDIKIFRDGRQPAAQAVVRFDNHWSGFQNAIEFEKSFQRGGKGKKQWIDRESSPGRDLYGWFAKEDDYKSAGPVGEYLRQNGELKTLPNFLDEATNVTKTNVANLVNEIEQTNDVLDELQIKYSEKSLSFSRMLEDHDRLHHSFNEEMRKLQHDNRENIRNVLAQQEKSNSELEKKKKELDSWNEELNKRDAITERERQNLQSEKEKSSLCNNALESASKKQRKADEDLLRLVEEQKREKEYALKKIRELQKDLEDKQKLEMEIEELRGKLEVMKHMGDDNDAALQKKIKETNKALAEKEDKMEYILDLNNQLCTKERQSNDELQEARKRLIKGLTDLQSGARVDIGLKRMGQVDVKAFKDACKLKFPREEDDLEAVISCSIWQKLVTPSNDSEESMADDEWYPFRVIQNENGQPVEVVQENDEKLKGLRDEWGDEVFAAVTTALKEVNEYNRSGRYVVPVLWNFKESRQATLKEVIKYITTQVDSLKKRKRR